MTFLTSIVVAIAISSFSTQAFAAPAPQPFVTVPVTRVHHDATVRDVHPFVFAAQVRNRALKRHALMAGEPAPSDAELAKNLHTAIRSLPVEHQKRYNRPDFNGIISSVLGTVENMGDTVVGDVMTILGGSANTEGAPSATTNVNGASTGSDSNSDSTSTSQAGLNPANEPTTPNSAGLDIEGSDVGYVLEVKIGTPERAFHLLADSGSSDLWVGSTNCSASGQSGCGKHTFIDEKSSSTFKNTGQSWKIQYGSGAVSGDIVTDNVEVAGLSLSNHQFGVAHTETSDFASNTTPFDGLLGLAKDTLSEQQVPTLVSALKSNGLIKNAIISYKLSRHADGKNDGEITFGAMDASKYDAKQSVTIKNVNTQGFWAAKLGSIAVGNKALTFGPQTVVFDTGTTLLLAPPQYVKAIHQNIEGAKYDNGSQSWLVPCNMSTPVSMSFGFQKFTIQPKDIAFSPVDFTKPDGACISGIGSGQTGDGSWLAGDVFLKNAYFSTNADTDELTLAQLI